MRHNPKLRQTSLLNSRNYAAEVEVHIDISYPISETAVCSDCYYYGTEVKCFVNSNFK